MSDTPPFLTASEWSDLRTALRLSPRASHVLSLIVLGLAAVKLSLGLSMAAALPDFSHLTPDERIELAEQLWESAPIDAATPHDRQIAELRLSQAELASDGDWGPHCKAALDEVAGRA